MWQEHGGIFRDDTIGYQKKQQWLDSEIEKVLQQKQAMEALEEDLKKREEIVKNREAMINEKSALEIKKLRSSQILNKVCNMALRSLTAT